MPTEDKLLERLDRAVRASRVADTIERTALELGALLTKDPRARLAYCATKMPLWQKTRRAGSASSSVSGQDLRWQSSQSRENCTHLFRLRFLTGTNAVACFHTRASTCARLDGCSNAVEPTPSASKNSKSCPVGDAREIRRKVPVALGCLAEMNASK